MAHILIIEDDEQMRKMLQRWLERAGFEVRVSGDGQEAMAAFQPGETKLVVTDIVMPDMDGVEVITRLRRQKPSPRIVAISGGGSYLAATDCLEWARNLGVEHAFTKPFDHDAFLQVVQDIMAEP